ncbi:DUF2061 domain-containing protein [Rhodobacteraceae bacterium KMM 6894]|nr:DUF2061 domain-containing protein [Rhodobacteraceae bacterium KMM 6894]
MDSAKRTVLKAMIWNLMGLAMMALVGLILTGSATLGGVMALINTGLGLCMYVIYERIWSRIRWGMTHG